MKLATNKDPASECCEDGNRLFCPIASRNKNVRESILSDLVAVPFRGHFPGKANSPAFILASFCHHKRD